MSSAGWAYVTLAVVSVAGAVQSAWIWARSPERVAVHFDLSGKPDRWMDRDAATWMMAAFQVGLPAALVLISRLAAGLPNELVNLPRKEYWLAPERRAETMQYMQERMGWIAVLTALFVMRVNQLTYQANQAGERLSPGGMIVLMALFIGGMAWLLGGMLRKFRRTEE
jgi:uncharacterized membrane protein